MVSFNAAFTPSRAGGSSGESSVTFGADVLQGPVFLSVDVIPSLAFARLMLTLGRVVRMPDPSAPRDHSEYQRWVGEQYLRELPAEMATAQIQVPALLARTTELQEKLTELEQVRRQYLWSDTLIEERHAFWQWLYTHDRDAWFVLDPIVSVQPDATFFEAFSIDESTYARVTLPHAATHSLHDPICGTTNIDFGIGLERELARTRSYRPLSLTVGAAGVAVDTGASSTIEKKIDLPESWVRGLVEVQAALSLAPIEIDIPTSTLADVLARLDAERERQGPRSLVFELTPGEQVRIVVEPWGDTFTAGTGVYEGDAARKIRVWGRRRLSVLRELLPLTSNITVRLIDSGMPSFWSVEMEGISFTLGLSGWTAQDWAGRARFSAMIPASAASEDTVTRASEVLRSAISMKPDQLAIALNCSTSDARLALQRLCVTGTAMYDPTSNCYRWRALFPELRLDEFSESGREERFGVDLFRSGAVAIEVDRFEVDERVLHASVENADRTNSVVVRQDVDARVAFAQCDCSHFRYHKLRQGPCRHIIATNLAGG